MLRNTVWTQKQCKMNIHDILTRQNAIYWGLKCVQGRCACTHYVCTAKFTTFLICTYWAVTRYLHSYPALLYGTYDPCAAVLLYNLYTILPTFSVEYLLGFSFSKRSSDITWQAYLLMRFIFLISNCCIASIESLSVCIYVSPSLLEELPDCNKLTWIEALWYEGFCSCKTPIS